MSEVGDERQRIESLRERISELCRASVRISSSLDLKTVLSEVVDCARSLTGARYGSVTTVDANGQLQEFVTRGTTPSEHQRIEAWTQGPRLFEYLRDLPGPIRLKNLPGHLQGIGFDGDVLRPYSPFQGTPMRHAGKLVGSFWLAQKHDGVEFSEEDEEILVLFASQAAVAIANARAYKEERRTRAHLEALIDTSPVGVVVFNATTGIPISLNREARRMMERLRSPGQSAEDLLKVISCKRADGSEIALDSLPLSTVLETAESVRAEEIVLFVPDGSSLSALVSSTPVHGEGGVESVVVTLQDLGPLQEAGRLRVDFLSMVSHELRLPLTSIKGATATVLDTQHTFGKNELLQFFRIVDTQADGITSIMSDLLDAGSIDAGTMYVSPEPTDANLMIDEARTAFLAGDAIHDVTVELPQNLPRVLADRGRIVQVLGTLLTNAARFTPPSTIRIAATTHDGHVELSIDDDGRGVAPEELPNLFHKYRGQSPDKGSFNLNLGLAICKGIVEAHGGRIRAESSGLGTGTRVTFSLPFADDTVISDTTGNVTYSRGERTRILAIDNDSQTLRFIRETLNDAAFDTMVTSTVDDIEHMLQRERPALVLMNLLLPGIDGVDLVGRTPALDNLPIIYMTAYDREESFSRALEAGGADYLVKPFSPSELIARVRGVLRRREGPPSFSLHDLSIDYRKRLVTLSDRTLDLTATEYNLLATLSRNAGRVSTYDELARRVWERRDEVDPKLVRAFIKRLRNKLGDPVSNPAYIFTERGVGYQMPQSDASSV